MADTARNWSVEIMQSGPCGYIYYREGEDSVRFYWEFGGGEVVAIISGPNTSEWTQQYAWAQERRAEIFRRVAEEVLRQEAASCIVEYPDTNTIWVREGKRTA